MAYVAVPQCICAVASERVWSAVRVMRRCGGVESCWLLKPVDVDRVNHYGLVRALVTKPPRYRLAEC